MLAPLKEKKVDSGILQLKDGDVVMDEESGSNSQRTRILSHSHKISEQAMRDQIKFMEDKLEASQAELEKKEELVRQLVNEKREANRNVETLEN